MSESKDDDWGFYAADASDSESSAEVDQSSGSDGRQSESNLGSSGGGTSMGSSTAGLAELNSLMHDSCEMGVAAWMRASTTSANGRRRCYFTTGDEFRSASEVSSNRGAGSGGGRSSSPSSSDSEGGNSSSSSGGRRRYGGGGGACSSSSGGRSSSSQGPPAGGRRRRCGRAMPQQLWCVTPFERRQVGRWHLLETALTPRLCPRVFSRQFADRALGALSPQGGGVVVGVSLGSVRVVQHKVTRIRHVEFLLMVSVGDTCRRAWRSHGHFARHARRRYSKWAPPCKAAWCIAESERRWRPCVDDYPYVAGRHAAYEALLREVLFHAESPEEILQLSGAEGANAAPDEATKPPEEEVLFGVEVPQADAAAAVECRVSPISPDFPQRVLDVVLPNRRRGANSPTPPTATPLPVDDPTRRGHARVSSDADADAKAADASSRCLGRFSDLAASFCDDRRTAPGSDERSYRALSSEDVGNDRKPPLAIALSGERRHRARRRPSDEHHPLFRKFTDAVPFAVDAVARAFA